MFLAMGLSDRTPLLGPGAWPLYISFVDPAAGRWRIYMMAAPPPSQFDVEKRQPVLTAKQAGVDVEGVKVWPFFFAFVLSVGVGFCL